MKKEFVPNKIIYFDKETIKNMLQEKYRGDRTTTSAVSEQKNSEAGLSADVDGDINLGMPLVARLKFAISGKIAVKYIIQRDSATTITSTEISDFESIRSSFKEFSAVKVSDIENSSTFFRTAGGYLRMLGTNIEGVNVKEFKSAMDSFEGYDVYRITPSEYVRFNNTAFVSNYKRSDLLTTELRLYCVYVGSFSAADFDFMQQLNKMQKLVSASSASKSLAELYPPKEASSTKPTTCVSEKDSAKQIKLYDVVYASVSAGIEEVE